MARQGDCTLVVKLTWSHSTFDSWMLFFLLMWGEREYILYRVDETLTFELVVSSKHFMRGMLRFLFSYVMYDRIEMSSYKLRTHTFF